MVAAIHEVDAQTSRHEPVSRGIRGGVVSPHGIENFRGHERWCAPDVQTPGYMRAPSSIPPVLRWSLRSMNWVPLDHDPVALRLATIRRSIRSPSSLSSRHLAECLQRGAERFGWSNERWRRQSMRADDGSFIGWGRRARRTGLIVHRRATRKSPMTAAFSSVSRRARDGAGHSRTALAAALGLSSAFHRTRRCGDRRHARCASALQDHRLVGHGVSRSDGVRSRRCNAKGLAELAPRGFANQSPRKS
jgi:hypothetical protein